MRFYKFPFFFLMILTCFIGFSQEKIQFKFNNRSLKIATQMIDQNNSSIVLGEGCNNISISIEGSGYNYNPVVKVLDDFYVISFKNTHQGKHSIYNYNSSLKETSLLFSSDDFNFLSTPELIFDNNILSGLLFLGNRSNNDDLFYYSLTDNNLVNLTETPCSEKKFEILNFDPLIIQVDTIQDEKIINFNVQTASVVQKRSINKNLSGSIYEEVKNKNDYDQVWYRTFMTFGDSITAGRMKMDWLPEDKEYEELAYTYKTQKLLEADFGAIISNNQGISGQNSYEGTQRIYQDLFENPGKYFFCLMGINDLRGYHSLDSTIESIEYIVDAALADNREVIMSTINPITERPKYPLQDDNIRALNPMIQELAQKKGLSCIDVYQTFIEYEPPYGWRGLLEDRENNSIHPNPLGHDQIAKLLTKAILNVKPEAHVLLSSESISKYRKKISWSDCLDFDYNNTVIEYGFSLTSLNHRIEVSGNEYFFTLIPFQFLNSNIYFRIRSIDINGNESAPTVIYKLNQ